MSLSCDAVKVGAVLTALAMGVSTAGSVGAQTVASKQLYWGPNAKLTIDRMKCIDSGVETIFVQGDVELIHPDDKPGVQPPVIFVQCAKFLFLDKSQVRSRATLYFLADKEISGSVDIVSTRAEPGQDAKDDPAIYLVRKAGNGQNGGPGKNGDSALFSSFDYPNGRNAENGGDGEAAGRGADGKGADGGSDGRSGTAASHVTLKALTYGPGTAVTINTRGGAGGKGAQGGRGGDGGDGGTGGSGGKGGAGADGRTAGNGGNGGRGGDGGDGARGGAAGNGGTGGAGGNISVLVIDNGQRPLGVLPLVLLSQLEGGLGGEPGIPGVGGAGGKGKPGGAPGCGGDGKGLIFRHGDGDCGRHGAHGVDGRDGDIGPSGKFGADGPPGRKGEEKAGYVLEDKKP